MANDTVTPDVIPEAAPVIPGDFFGQGSAPAVPASPKSPVPAKLSARPAFEVSAQPDPLPEQVQGTNPDGEEGSKFLTRREAARLRAMHETINNYLKIDGIDTTRVDVKDAKVDEKKGGLVMTLEGGREVTCGTNAEGREFIRITDDQPMTREMAAIGASLCKSRGWDEVIIGTGRPEEIRAMMAIEVQKLGLTVLNPPADDIMEKVRKEMEAEDKAKNAPAAAVASPAAPDDNYGRTAPATRTFLGEPVDKIEKWHDGQTFDEMKPFERILAASSLKAQHIVDNETAPADRAAAIKDFKNTLELLVTESPAGAASFCAHVLDHPRTADLKEATQEVFKDALTGMLKTDPAGARRFAEVQLETRTLTSSAADVIRSIPALTQPPQAAQPATPRASAPGM